MATSAGQANVNSGNAYLILRKALDDPGLLSTLFPVLTNEGRSLLLASGITESEHGEFCQVLTLATLGAQQRNTAVQQQSVEASAFALLRRASIDEGFLATLWPKLTNEGRLALQEAGFDNAAQAEFLEMVNTGVIGRREQNAFAKQIQQLNNEQQLEVTRVQLEQQIHILKEGKVGFDETMAVAQSMREGLKRTINQIDRAFNYTMFMYVVSFCVGLALIIAAMWFARLGREHLLTTIVLGGLGTASTLTFFFTKPPERLQSSRASLAQLQIALLAWFNDFYNQNVMLGQLNQLQVSAGKIDEAPLTKISQTIIDHTEKMMVMLQRYCKLVENPDDGTIKTIHKKHDKLAVTAAKAESEESKPADPVPIAS